MASRLLVLALASLASAQQIGKTIPEQQPALTTWRCTKAGGCKSVNNTVTLEATARRILSVADPLEECKVGRAPCDDAATCGKACSLEGIDYASRGVWTKGDSLTLRQWDDSGRTVSPRIYLLGADGKTYENVSLLNMEFTFDVELAKLPCGMNGALYLSEMELDGGRALANGTNPAGATYGTGYCDAQCPKLDWINGQANTARRGVCCNEMDLWEANNAAQVYTPHPCRDERVYGCKTDIECGQPEGVCDQWGCSYNQYQTNPNYYGPGKNFTVDSSRKITVVTQFHTDPATGKLNNVRRLFLQDGKLIANAPASSGVADMSNAYCKATASWTEKRGGLAKMGDAVGRGMVLIFSLWNDVGGFMNWMDTGKNGPCNETEGNPDLIYQHTPDAQITFSAIKWGEINSTYTKP